MRYTYSYRHSAPRVSDVDAEELMEAMSDDLLSDGNVEAALRRVVRWGVHSDDQQRIPGLQSLLQQLRSQRQRELERYNPDSLLHDIDNKLDEIVASERAGIDRRLTESNAASESQDLLSLLNDVADRKRTFLDELPQLSNERIRALADYEFLDDAARSHFQALLGSLEQQVLRIHSDDVRRSLARLTEVDMQGLKSMLRDLTSLLEQRLLNLEPNMDSFVSQHGRHFPGASSLDDIVSPLLQQAACTELLVRSMSAEMRRSLEKLVESVVRDEELREEIVRMEEVLHRMTERVRPPHQYAFCGVETLTLEESLRIVKRLYDLDELERDMQKAQESGNTGFLEASRVAEVMGEDAGHATQNLQRVERVLQDAGYLEVSNGVLDITPRAVRKMGQKALQDIFRHLKRDAFGKHSVQRRGLGGDRADETKPYEFGDPFLLDMHTTLMNALHRNGGGSPVHLGLPDFEVFATEFMTRSSTVLMLDMSRSMPLRGCFAAAKKVTFALNSLIRDRYPRDRLYIIGFSDYARELNVPSLHRLTWGDKVYGTNMQHGFMLARRLLGRHGSGNKQIILVTDGEPTAHFEGERITFSYPPTFRTFQETLREVKRCSQEGIVINTFMLDRSHYLTDFVNQMTRINRGRAFFATPDRLGDYILLDYVTNKQRVTRPRVTSAWDNSFYP